MTKPIRKIGFLLPHIVMGGVEKVLLEILKEVQKQRPDWQITVYSRKPVTDKYFCNFFKDTHITLKDRYSLTIPKTSILKLPYQIVNLFYRQIARILMRQSVKKEDFLIDFQFLEFRKDIAKYPIPKISWLHGSISFLNVYCHKKLQYIQYYNKIVCLSDSLEKDFKEQYPQYQDKIIRIYNSINVTEISKKAKIDSSQGKYFCIVSRLNPDKDNETVISAFKLFSKNHPEAKLLIAGEGPFAEKLHNMAANYPQIEFLGQVDEPYTLMKNSIGCILSSYNEGFAMVLLENAALGVLSISSKCKSGPPEILMNGKAGLLFTPGDRDELAKILEDVWTEKIDTQKLIQTATANLDRFSIEKNTGQIIQLIEEIYHHKTH